MCAKISCGFSPQSDKIWKSGVGIILRPNLKYGFHYKYFLEARKTGNISVPNFVYSNLQISYGFHCKNFYQTQNIPMALLGEILYRIPL
jgi:hypothetical protein